MVGQYLTRLIGAAKFAPRAPLRCGMLADVSAMVPPPDLFEREGALQTWRRLRALGARHVTVIGPPGVGKRTFVRLLATLDDAPDVTVVASTHRLGVPGEHLLELEPLSMPAAGATTSEIADAPAVRCFLRFAGAVDPTLAVNENNAPDLLRICRAVDGLPGALEALAGRLRIFTLSRLAERLDGGDVLNATGPLASLAPAWNDVVLRVSSGAQDALRALATLPDAVAPDTAEALVRSGAPLDVLTELRDASLLARDGDRLRVLAIAKSAVRLVCGPVAEETRRVAFRVSELCHDRVTRYTRSADAKALQWMQLERQNLVAAWDGLVTPAGGCAEDAIEPAWWLSNALMVVHSRYGSRQSRHDLKRVLRFAEAPGRLEGAPLLSLVWLARWLYDVRDSEWLERVVRIADERAPTDPGVAWARACVASARSRAVRLEVLAREAVMAARAAGELFWEARSWAFCVAAATARGDWRGARTSGENGVRCAEAIDSEVALCMMLPNLVFVCARLGERRDARLHAARALECADRCSDRRAYATTLANLAYAELDWDDLANAEDLLRRALALHLQLGLADYASLTEVSLARVLALRGDTTLVEDHLDRAETRLARAPFDDDLAVTRLRAAGVRADLCEARHDWNAARDHIQSALDTALPQFGAEDRLLLLGRVMALSHVLGESDAVRAAEKLGIAMAERCFNPHLRVAWEVYLALSSGEGDWPNRAKRLAFLARVPLAQATPGEGGEPAYHSSLVVRAALEFVWCHLGDARRDDVTAYAKDPAGEALVVSHDGSRFRPSGGAFVDLAHRPALVRLLAVLTDARTGLGGRPLSEDALVAALWPGEKMLPAAATNRLQNALSLLRRAGLKDSIAFTADGYMLEPSGRVEVLGQGLNRRAKMTLASPTP